MRNKTFDCVEIKRKSQEIIYNEIKNMSRKEEINYWKESSKKLDILVKSK